MRLPVVAGLSTDEVMTALKKQNIPTYATCPRGNILPYALDLTSDFCLMLGNEAHGLSQKITNSATALVKLPMSNTTESLNASVAGSILIYEAVRQRSGL